MRQILAPRRGERSRQRRQGATLLLFLLVLVPFAMFSMMMSADLTRVIDAQRQAGYIAANAATAGSLQYRGSSDTLDTARAQQVAAQTAQAAINAGALRHGASAQASASASSRQVTVTVTYQLDRLLIAQYFIGSDSTLRRASRTAEVCRPGSTSYTGGFCSRPRA